MKQEHLDNEKLHAIYKGDHEDLRALEHLASCDVCQQAFDDSRWLALLQRLPAMVDAGSHPDDATLGAYRLSALSEPRAHRIERHLRSCSRCLARYRGLGDEYSSLPPEAKLVRRVRKSFSPAKMKWLGTVLLTGLDRGPRAVLLPEQRVASGRELFAEGGVHPSSARGRAARLRRSASSLPTLEESVELFRVAAHDFAAEPDGVQVATEDWRLSIELRDDRPGTLTVRLIPLSADLAAEGVRLRVEQANEPVAAAITDAEGRAEIRPPQGRSRIVVETDPPLAVSLNQI